MAKLTATTPFGTFSRKTARAYTHVVIAEGVLASALQKNYDASAASFRQNIARYEQTLANYRAGVDPRKCDSHCRPAGTEGGEWDRTCTARYLANGNYEKWLQDSKDGLVKLFTRGRPTCNAPGTTLIGWCGRKDLAEKLASSTAAHGYYYGVHIYPVD